MPRTTFVWRDGALIEKHLAPPQSGVFHFISDTMDAVAHPCTGKLMDSKSEFRKVTRAHGCIEMGNDAPTSAPARGYDSGGLKQDIARAFHNPDRRAAETFSSLGLGRD